MYTYTSEYLWRLLVNGTEDIDEQIDLAIGLSRLPLSYRAFLVLLAAGYTAGEAMEYAQLHGNQTRIKREALSSLASAIDGGQNEDRID